MAFRQKKFELSPRLKLGVGRSYSQNQILKIASILCLVLAGGLALNAARLIYKTSSSQDGGFNAPTVLGATDVKASGSQNSSVQIIEYPVAKGDTLFNISQKFNIDWATLATINNLKSPFPLKSGQILKIPKP